MLKRVLMGTTCVVLLGFAFVNVKDVISGAPAFDSSARETGVYGDWRTAVGPAHYFRSDYLQQLSEGYLRADVLESENSDQAQVDPDADYKAIENARRAEELLTESLTLSPSNAHAWSSLSWARALQGNIDGARSAMETSWKLAPYNIALARTRLPYAEFLAQSVIESDLTHLTQTEKVGIQSDFSTVWNYDRRMANEILGASTMIAELQTVVVE